MASRAFRGGSGAGNFHSYSDYDSEVVYDSISWPVGNINLTGSRVVVVSSVSPVSAGGITSATVSSDGYVRLYGGSARLNFDRNSAAGGTINATHGGSWAGGLCGSFSWYTVATAPASIGLARTGRDVQVSVGASASNGDATITAYRVHYSLDGGTTWSTSQLLVAGVYTFTGLPPASTVRFRAYAVNAAGNSAGIVSSDMFIPAGGKVKESGAFRAGNIAKRKLPDGTWVDLTIAKRKAAGVWVDLS